MIEIRITSATCFLFIPVPECVSRDLLLTLAKFELRNKTIIPQLNDFLPNVNVIK